MGQPEKALPVLERAARLDPNFPVPDLFMGYALDRLGRQQDAIRRWERVLTRQPDNLAAHIALAAAYVETDQPAKARAAAAEIRRVSPDFTLSATALSTDYLSAQHLDALHQLGFD